MNTVKFFTNHLASYDFLFYLIIYAIFSFFVSKNIIYLLELREIVVFFTFGLFEIYLVSLTITFFCKLIKRKYFCLLLAIISGLLVSVIFLIQGLSIFFSDQFVTVLALENYTEGRYINFNNNIYIFFFFFLMIANYLTFAIYQYKKYIREQI
jgi:hypothetical protein